MFLNTFLGIKLRRFAAQIIIIFAFIFITIYIVKTKTSIQTNNRTNTEILFEQENFNKILLKKRKQQSAPNLKVKVKYGDTLESILKNHDFLVSDIVEAIKEIKKVFNPKNIITGKTILIKYQLINKKKKLVSIKIPLQFNKIVFLENAEDKFIGKIISKQTINRIIKKNGIITDSLYLSALKSGVDIKTITKVIGIFSFSVDFQRDIWPKDTFEILYEEELLKYDKSKKESGNVLYASLVLKSGVSLKLYKFTTKSGDTKYFDERGKSAQKLLMKTPIDGARISSSFGKRKHPILGYNVAHRGIDFAAPKGTPIYAAGNGTIEIKKKNGAYGKYILIRHANRFKTAYAHLSKYAKTSGKVTQGQVIGYVGSTGRSTGPHLHYEIIKNGKRINPKTLKLPSGKKLKGDELEIFMEEKNKIERRLDNLDVY